MSDLELAILRSCDGRCLVCNALADRVDHVKPRHANGPHIPENLVPLCDTCNRTKSCMWPRHGYHPMPGYDSPGIAIAILAKELEYLEGIYGERRLVEAIGG